MRDIPFHSHHNGKKAEILALMQMFAAVVSARRNHRVLVAENYFERSVRLRKYYIKLST